MPPRKSLYGNTGPTMPELPLTRVAALHTATQVAVQSLPVDAIDPNPFQARTTFENLDDLADAMRVHGFTSRLRVRPHPDQNGRFQLVFGERRLRAARMVGLNVVPCEIVPHSDADMIEIGLAENIQREDLRPMEEARALHAFIEERGYSIRQLAERIGKKKGYVQNRLDLLRMPDDVQQMVEDYPETFTAASFIRNVPRAQDRQPLIDAVVRGELNKEEVREMVQQLTAAETVSPARSAEPPEPGTEQASPDQDTALPSSARVSTKRSSSDEGVDINAVQDKRRARQSGRALSQAKQTFVVMLNQAVGFAEDMSPEDRNALLTFIVEEHFPKLERFVEELRPAS